MLPSARYIAAAFLAAMVFMTAGCDEPCSKDALVARTPDGMRMAVATAGARNVRVLYVNGASIVRLHEAFVGAPIAGIAWSDDGRELIVRTSGAAFAIDARTGRVAQTVPPALAERR